MASQKKVLWLKFGSTRSLQSKESLLAKNGYQLIIASSYNEVVDALGLGRFTIVIISDDGPRDKLREDIQKVMNLNEIRLARFILSCEFFYSEVIKFCVDNNFRDILPFDLANTRWIYRFKFSTVGRQIEVHTSRGKISVSDSAQLHIPARIVHISQSGLRLESHLQPSEGASMTIEGGLCDFLGVSKLTFIASKSHSRHLNYRFSNGLFGKWESSLSSDQIEKKLIELKEREQNPGYRVFAILKDNRHRKAVFSYFEGRENQLNVALNISTIADEQRYFSPHIIFIDTKVCNPSNEKLFDQIFSDVDERTLLVFLGVDLHELFRRKLAKRAHFIFESLNRKVLDDITSYSVNGVQAVSSSVYLSRDVQESFAKIIVPAKLESLHPEVIDFRLQFPLKIYALGYISSSLISNSLQRGLWFKSTNVSMSSIGKGYRVSGFITDLDNQSKISFARYLQKIAIGYYDNYIHEQVEASNVSSDPVVGSFQVEANVQNSQSASDSIKAQVTDDSPHSQSHESPTKRLPRFFYIREFQYFLVFIALTFGILFLISFVVPFLSKTYERSGRPFTESLKKFSGQKDP